jgi:hypothetical protein
LKADDQQAPFTHEILSNPSDLSLLPASYRTGERADDMKAASPDIAACLRQDLDLHRIHRVWKWMWVVGLPMPPRPLHQQLLMSRDIFITEQMDMHLVWTTGRIFLKPIPRYLLHSAFWKAHLTSIDNCGCFIGNKDKKQAADNGNARNKKNDAGKCSGGLRKRAFGFLFSYAALLAYESDFCIAKEKKLIPEEVKWDGWQELVKKLLEFDNIYDNIDERFKFGELRLSRLNKIYRLSHPLKMRGYMTHWHQYGGFLQDNFAFIASTTVYIAIVLTAMQVGLATPQLKDNKVFNAVSYGFTVFSILAPLGAGVLIIIAFLILFFCNWFATKNYWKVRAPHVHLLEPDSEKTRTLATTTPV